MFLLAKVRKFFNSLFALANTLLTLKKRKESAKRNSSVLRNWIFESTQICFESEMQVTVNKIPKRYSKNYKKEKRKYQVYAKMFTSLSGIFIYVHINIEIIVVNNG